MRTGSRTVHGLGGLGIYGFGVLGVYGIHGGRLVKPTLRARESEKAIKLLDEIKIDLGHRTPMVAAGREGREGYLAHKKHPPP